jgi:outer membrane protein TolC
MIQTLKTIRLVGALLALSVSFVSASEPQAEKASEAAIAVRGLHDSVSLAIQNNPELAAAKAEYKARHRSQFISFSTMLPQVTAYATGYYHKTGEDDPGETWNENEDDAYGLRVTYDVFTSGKNLNAFRRGHNRAFRCVARSKCVGR